MFCQLPIVCHKIIAIPKRHHRMLQIGSVRRLWRKRLANAQFRHGLLNCQCWRGRQKFAVGRHEIVEPFASFTWLEWCCARWIEPRYKTVPPFASSAWQEKLQVLTVNDALQQLRSPIGLSLAADQYCLGRHFCRSIDISEKHWMCTKRSDRAGKRLIWPTALAKRAPHFWNCGVEWRKVPVTHRAYFVKFWLQEPINFLPLDLC